ncbi:MAG: clostripain-related cysteine peptidase, partial [Thermoleophilia bacterium]
MKGRTILAAAALCVLFCAAPSTAATASSPAPTAPAASSPAPTAPTRAAWTFAVYANADNDLEYTWPQFTLRALRALPANADVNVVAMIDWRSAKKGVQLLQFSGRSVKVVASWPDKDFGSGATFQWFLRQVTSRYPSDHLGVDIWDHGYGWRYVSRDFTSHDKITMPELRLALRRAATPIDVLCFDACNMANIEAVDELGETGLVGYVVGSEETIDQDGYPYDGALRPLMTDASRTPRQVATDMVSAWRGYYRPLRCFNWVSLSALDVPQVMRAKTDITAWVARLRADLPQDRQRYAADLHHSIYAWDCWYVDLADIAERLAADPAITDPTLKVLSTAVADDLS